MLWIWFDQTSGSLSMEDLAQSGWYHSLSDDSFEQIDLRSLLKIDLKAAFYLVVYLYAISLILILEILIKLCKELITIW